MNTPICNCEQCQALLNLERPTGKLEIWYGTGNNGKTTLLNALKDQYDHNDVLNLTPMNLPDLQKNIELVCFTELNDHDHYLTAMFLDKYLKKNVRCILTTNKLEKWMHSNFCHITHFTHTF